MATITDNTYGHTHKVFGYHVVALQDLNHNKVGLCKSNPGKSK